ncbi:hypothetical protein [Algoriphagus sp.]|uniref:hypothetical protein n=1 Tax=Algoriphagus sp. TaxID=1872435 RepID=UPI00327E2D9A
MPLALVGCNFHRKLRIAFWAFTGLAFGKGLCANGTTDTSPEYSEVKFGYASQNMNLSTKGTIHEKMKISRLLKLYRRP